MQSHVSTGVLGVCKSRTFNTAAYEAEYDSDSQPLEMFNTFQAGGPVPHPEAQQPQVHIGMQAIPQLNPADNTSSFF